MINTVSGVILYFFQFDKGNKNMNRSTRTHATLRLATLALLCAGLTGLFLPRASAEDLKTTTALKFVPADVALYDSTLRGREIYDNIVKSNAFAKIKEMESVDELLKQVAPQMAQFQGVIKTEPFKGMYDTGIDMLSNEIFVYASGDSTKLMSIFQQINTENQIQSLSLYINLMTGNLDMFDPDIAQQQPKAMMKILADNIDELKVPTVVMGFKATNPDRARAQLPVLESMLTQALAQEEILKDSLKKETIDGNEYLVMRLDGAMIPMEEDDIEDIAEELGDDVRKLVAKLKETKIAISLGVRENYVLLTIGPDTSHLKKIGKGKLLADIPEMAPVFKQGDKRVVSIGYASKKLMKAATYSKEDIDQLLKGMSKLIPPLPGALQADIQKDLAMLSQDIQKNMPTPGAVVDVAWLSEYGIEELIFDHSTNKIMDGSQPLSLLDHVGGDPMFCMVARVKNISGIYEMEVKWMKRIWHYVTAAADLTLATETEEYELYKKARKALEPVFVKLDKVNREKLVPAFKDGHSGIVFDVKSKDTQWFAMQPESDKPLPMLEVGTLDSINNPKAIKEAGQVYFDAVNMLLKKASELDPEVPSMNIPGPQVKKVTGGTIYYYPLPEEWGVSKKIAPNAGLGKKVLVLTTAPEFSERLLKKTPLSIEGALPNATEPAAAAVICNFPLFVDAVMDWIEYGNTQEPLPEGIWPQIQTGAEVLKCFRGGSWVQTIRSDGVTVHRIRIHFKDIEK